MRQFLICGGMTLLIFGCTTQQSNQESLVESKQVFQEPILLNIEKDKTSSYLLNGNDPSLERAFNQYVRLGKAANIISEGFIKFAYNAGQQPVIQTGPFQETVVSLEPGEKFTNISSGDPNRWSYAVAVSGSGIKQQQNILVKPSSADIATNMVVTTDKRIYNLRLVSLNNAKSLKAISFWYPEEMVETINESILKQNNAERIATVPDVNLKNLHFNYAITCGWFCHLPSWSPIRVFDDGIHTYIQFPQTIANQDMPVLFVLVRGTKQLVNYRFKSPYFVVDNIFKQAVLVVGVGQSKSVVTITNKHFV